MAGMFPTNKEITVFGNTIRFPGVTDEGEYTNGDFNNPATPPSYIDAETQNLILHNLNNLIAQLGGTANNTDKDQLAALFTVAATALRGVQRDSRGRAKVAAPLEDDDIARKAEIDAEAKTRSDDDIAISTSLSNHTHNKDNPHGITKTQVGLGNVDNTADKDKSVKSATTCSGNAASATKWQTARNINGMSVQGDTDRVNYAVCSTAAGTQAKACDCAGFALVTGAEITVKFTNTNTQANPTLNVNGTGAKVIYYRGAAIAAGNLAANRTYTFRYNGTQYELVGDINTDTNTTYSNATQSANGLMSAADKKKLDGITTYSEATASAAGLMSATDKSRLNNNYVTASNFGTSSGYIKYSNGMIIQWGTHKNVITGATSSETVTLPIGYSNTNYAILCTYYRTDSGGLGFNHYNNVTQSSFKVAHDSSSELKWMTIGY